MLSYFSGVVMGVVQIRTRSHSPRTCSMFSVLLDVKGSMVEAFSLKLEFDPLKAFRLSFNATRATTYNALRSLGIE